MGLFRELSEECVKFAKLRKRYRDVEMGPISDEQLVIAPGSHSGHVWPLLCLCARALNGN